VLRLDNQLIDVESSGSPCLHEGKPEIQVVFRDITERKRAEEALQASEQRFRSLIENSWDAVALFAADGTILYSSPSQMRILGYASEHLLGRNALELVCPEDRESVRELLRESLQKPGQGVKAQAQFRHQDGSWRDLEGTFTNLLHEPSVNAIVNNYRDVTARRQAEEERRKLEAQVLHAQKLESLGVLAGGIAHDFNNLLTGILGYASLARMQLPPGSPVLPMLQEIERGGERAADLAQQMLAYSGRGKFAIRTIALDTLVGEMSNLLQTVVSKKAILHLDLAPALIDGDVTQIRQVVMNLITNASDALGGQEGVILVRTGSRHCDRTVLRSPYLPDDLPEGAYAYVQVCDSGCGMSEDTLRKIFDPFFTTKSTGRGLGLAAVLGIVRGHRGTLQVSSSPGQGATFEMLLPLATAANAAPAAVSAQEARPRGKGLILVVDDEEGVRSFVRRVLESAGFQVRVASDGREGVAVFEQYREEVRGVVLDLTMPHMDGLEVAQRLNGVRLGVPILLMSGYNEQEIAARFDEIDVVGLIQKPFRQDDLLARVCQMLPE
jgi:PAS domain S-box-containing protein